MELLCGFLIGVVVLAVVGHLLWLFAAAVVNALFGTDDRVVRPPRPFRDCPACGTETEPRDRECLACGLELDGRRAHKLYCVRVAEREVRTLLECAQIERDTADAVLKQLEVRARSLQGLPAERPRARLVAKPVSAPAIEPPPPVPEPLEQLPPVLATLDAAEPVALPPVEPGPPREPARRRSGFLEEHNILWGELVGGLLIVGCSIALVVTLRQTLEAIPYFRFMLSAAVTLALFGAGQYTLHRWKLAGTSRGMLVISMLLTPLTLLLLAAPFTEGTQAAVDIAVKVAALLTFVAVVRTGGRDLIGTEHLPGPVDRRWLLALAVVGAAGTQLLPATVASAWLPLLCFAVACGATLGGLSWYHPNRRDEPISDRSGTALLMFVGMAAFALVAAWGLYVVRDPSQMAVRLHWLAVPLALAGVPVVEAGVLVLRRVASAGLRTAGTAVALAGFVIVTVGLAIAWPDPLALLLVSAATGLYLTRVAFREKLAWVQVGAIGLLAFAAVIGFHGGAGNWNAPPALNEQLGSSESGAVLVGFALVLALLAELLARRASRQTTGYAAGALCTGTVGLLLVSWNGVPHPATAAFAHAAGALGLLASNVRWKRRALAHGGLYLLLAGTLWALWWQAPNQPAIWGFTLAVEALAFAVGAVLLRGAHAGATALLRRAGRDVAFVACVLAVVIAATSLTLESAWHSGTLLAIALASVALARLTGAPAFTWAASAVALLGFVHLAVFTGNAKPETLAVEVALLAHATLAALAAVVCRRQARVFGEPLRWAARLSSALAVPLLFAPGFGFALAYAGLAVWLGVLWLTFALAWRERGGFSAFQAALTLAALLIAFGWVERQEWWRSTTLALADPRALHAFGIALGALALAWVVGRRALLPNARARELWCDNPLSLDRLVLAATVVGFLLLTAIALSPAAIAELTPARAVPVSAAPAELAHAFGASGSYLFFVLWAAVGYSWWLSKFDRDTGVHVLGLALVAVAHVLVWAGTHAADVAAASALRWGLAVAFVAGSALVALRVPARRGAAALGFPVQPSPWLRPALLALFACAAGVVLFLSATVAQLGLDRVKPSGPLAASVFAQMGPMLSNLAPLALVVGGLALTAARERSPGYAFGGGVVFVVTLCAGYALAVVTAGGELGGSQNIHLWLLFAGGAAAWAALWLAAEARVTGGILLAIQSRVGLFALAWVALTAGARFIESPSVPPTPPLVEFGRFGWFALALAAGVAVWRARRTEPGFAVHALALTAAIAAVLAACAVQPWDADGAWLSFHTLALALVVAGSGLLAARQRPGVWWWLTASAGVLIACALSGGWYDPWKPYLPAGLSLAAGLLLGAFGLSKRSARFAFASMFVVNLAAVFVWVAWGPNSLSGFLLANAAGLAVASACWTLARVRGGERAWLQSLDYAVVPSFALLLGGLAGTFAGTRTDPPALTWGVLAAVAFACAVALWDRGARFARPGLFAAGVLAMLLAVAEADARAVWNVPATPLALAAYALVVTLLAVALARRAAPLLRMPERGDSWPWLLAALPLLAVLAGALGLWTGLRSPELLERLANPGAVALLALAFALLTRFQPEAFRLLSAAVGVYALVALAWAVPDPAGQFVWLHRNAWLFVALAFAGVIGSETAARLSDGWRRAVRTVAGWAAVGAVAVLCLNLLQQVPTFDPVARRTPLSRETSLAMLAGIAALFVLALRFALTARDPFALRPARKTAYVYLAEVLIVLFFTHIRFNVPELFLGNIAKLWTFAVMALAYAGIGLAELFERNKIAVLALPLRRTGVLLPLIPLVAFWAKPPATVSEFAQTSAPGLGPLLGYLQNLPQHFDTYAWLWFLAGGVYGFVALSKKSFGWALLAALATNAAMWSLLAHNEVPFFVHPQAWVIPLALIVLASEHINRRRLRPDVSNGMRYAGVAMIYVASAADMFLAGVGTSTWLPVVLAVLCVCGVLAGVALRVRAFVYLGVGFLLLDVFAMIWHAAVNLQQTWVWYASGIVLGVVVLALFAYLEKRRESTREPGNGE